MVRTRTRLLFRVESIAEAFSFREKRLRSESSLISTHYQMVAANPVLGPPIPRLVAAIMSSEAGLLLPRVAPLRQ